MRRLQTLSPHWSDGSRGRDQRRSPLDVIMSQIRRKRTASDRKPLGRFLSWSSERPGIPEDGEAAAVREERGPGPGERRLQRHLSSTGQNEHQHGATEVRGQRSEVCVCVPVSGAVEVADSECDLGWGRVCVFLQRLGKKADSSSLNLAHCDLTATDLLELGGALSLFTSFIRASSCNLASNPNPNVNLF